MHAHCPSPDSTHTDTPHTTKKTCYIAHLVEGDYVLVGQRRRQVGVLVIVELNRLHNHKVVPVDLQCVKVGDTGEYGVCEGRG